MRKGEKDEELSDFSEETFEDQSGQASDEYVSDWNNQHVLIKEKEEK